MATKPQERVAQAQQALTRALGLSPSSARDAAVKTANANLDSALAAAGMTRNDQTAPEEKTTSEPTLDP